MTNRCVADSTVRCHPARHESLTKDSYKTFTPSVLRKGLFCQKKLSLVQVYCTKIAYMQKRTATIIKRRENYDDKSIDIKRS